MSPELEDAVTASVGNLRSADLPTLANALTEQRTRAVDVVIPASRLRASGGSLVIEGCDPLLSDAGVTVVDGRYRPTRVGEEGIAGKLDIPLRYLSRTRSIGYGLRPDSTFDPDLTLWDANVNALLGAAGDAKYLCRMLKNRDGDPGADGADGVLRAFLSDSYRCIDSFDVLLAALEGLGQAGAADAVEVQGDLTDRKMIVRVRSTALAALAPKLLEGYRSPFSGEQVGGIWTPELVANAAQHEGQSYEPGTEPILFAGFVITNSEVGDGALDLRPELHIRVCRNGLVIKDDSMRRVHLGAKMQAGTIQWSGETIRRNLALVTSQVTDAVNTWMSPEYLSDKVAELEKQAEAASVELDDAPAVITAVSRKLGFDQDAAKGILAMFIKGADPTAKGVMHALTAHAQTVDDGDVALDMEMKALDAMLAATELANA